MMGAAAAVGATVLAGYCRPGRVAREPANTVLVAMDFAGGST